MWIATAIENQKQTVLTVIGQQFSATFDLKDQNVNLSFWSSINIVVRILVISRASFCCTKKLKKLHLFLTKVAKSCIYAQAF